ncbi:membrane-spanning 4-domains subfamily A member 5 [Sciurus carolinensis]|uniref:membrane-spanning 4-domains subfamily A member 5 n=1 Tax=Sciurus carolinensis TaxID=30640 RepID=UPI001FB3F104|nr:membrane-spanning 4-domains subfamily A member 5 [Sciurus carolinensis]
MDPKDAHSPVFLVFPPEINIPEYQSKVLTATTFASQNLLQKLLTTKLKILGATQILIGIINFSFGIVFLFTSVPPYPRFPFILISAYPFWGSALFIMSGAFLIALKRKTTESLIKVSRVMNFLSAVGATAGIILLIFGFLLDRNYICGYSPEGIRCREITALLIGIFILLMILSIIELLISLSFSICGCHSED